MEIHVEFENNGGVNFEVLSGFNSREIYDKTTSLYIQLIYFMEPQMCESPHPQGNLSHINQSNSRKDFHENIGEKKKILPVNIPRRPGRPSLRGRGRVPNSQAIRVYDAERDEDYQIVKSRGYNKNTGVHEESNMDGFIRIIDYLKKIDCDEASLHNKMNPYNLLTPTCFWYIISAEYFSFDFFNNRNPNDAAIQILRRAQKTFVTIPQRIIKPLRVEGCLQFETEELREASRAITQKLTSMVKPPMILNADGLQKTTYITSVNQDDLFRSSTRSIVFNYLKKKMSTNQKWLSALQPLFDHITQQLPSKQMEYYIMNIEDEEQNMKKMMGTEMLYRQKRKTNVNAAKKDITENKSKIINKKPKNKTKSKSKNKRNRKSTHNANSTSKNQDKIFHQSDQQQQIDNTVKNQQEDEDDEDVIEEQAQVEEQEKQQQQPAKKQQQFVMQEQLSEQQHQNYAKNQQEHQKQQQLIKQQYQGHQGHKQIREQLEQHDHEQQDHQQQQQQLHDDQNNQKGNVPINKRTKILASKFMKEYNHDDILLDAVLHLPIDHIISLLQASINPIQLPPIIPDPLPMPKNQPLDLVYQIHTDEQKFLEYMKDRQERIYQDKITNGQETYEEIQRQIQIQDAKCQVCTDGDYTEDNLIVFCSMCGISVHQRCVGLNKVPAENWICQVCLAFGAGGCNVPCPLCNVKGGALKRTSIHINQPLFKETNPAFNQYSKSCPFVKQKQEYTFPILQANAQVEPFYDYFMKSSYKQDLPTCHYIWVHYVCAIWVPQCYFEEKNGAINIKGIQNIDKRRFREKCLACNQIKSGACVKCDNISCSKYYHPQCARKKKIYMEQLNLDKLRYLIFCEAHQPLKVKRKIQIKKKKNRDEIVKFCRGIQKYVETYKIAPINFKLMKTFGPIDKHDKNDVKDRHRDRDNQNEDMKVMIKVQRNSDEDFIKTVIETLMKSNQIVVNLTKLGNNRYKIDEIVKPSKREMRKSLNRVEQFWKNFNNGQPSDANLRRFNNIVRENIYLKEKIENYINYGDTDEPKALWSSQQKKVTPGILPRKGTVGRRPKIVKETMIQQQGGIFCVCRKPYQGETEMFECQVCNQWYHHECIGFIGSQDDAQGLDFHCMKCMKFESEQARIHRLDRCGKLFRQDSLFLNYRPPTPSLQSESQQNQQKMENAQEINPQSHQQIIQNPYSNDKQMMLNKSPQKNFESPESKHDKSQKHHSANKSKIYALLDKPFVIDGPHQRQDDQEFFFNRIQQRHSIKQKQLKMQENKRIILQSGMEELQQINRQQRQYKQQKQYKQKANQKQVLSSNIVQMQSISFKGQFINRNGSIPPNQEYNSQLEQQEPNYSLMGENSNNLENIRQQKKLLQQQIKQQLKKLQEQLQRQKQQILNDQNYRSKQQHQNDNQMQEYQEQQQNMQIQQQHVIKQQKVRQQKNDMKDQNEEQGREQEQINENDE